MINPDFIRTFMVLAKVGHFTRAAQALKMTQPGVTKHVQSLEAHFGVALIQRHGKTFEVTDSGKRLVKYGEQMFSEYDRLQMSIGADDPHAGLCRFASPGSFGMKMYTFLLKLNARYRGLSMQFSYAPNASIVRDLLEDRIDVGFVTAKPDHPAIESVVVDRERLCLVVPKLFKGSDLQSLKKLGFINHPDGFHHASRLLQENFKDEFGTMEEFEIHGFINQINRILEPVALNLGFTALPLFAVESFLGRKEVKIFPLKRGVEDPIYWITKRHRTLPARFSMILDAFRKS